MNLEDLLQAIAVNQSGIGSAEILRRQRVRILTGPESPIVLVEGCRVFIHVIPLATRLPIRFRDDRTIDAMRQHGKSAGANDYTYNIDGCMRYSKANGGRIAAYLLYMRGGFVEQCVVYASSDPAKTIPGMLLDTFIAYNIPDAIDALAEMGQSFPMAAFVTVTGVKSWSIAGARNTSPIDREELWLEGVQIDSKLSSPETIVTPLADAIWNASGVQRTPNL